LPRTELRSGAERLGAQPEHVLTGKVGG